MKFDQSGKILWLKNYSAQEINAGFSIYPASDKGYVIASQNESGAWIFKIDEDGSIIWEKIYKLSSNDRRNSVCTAAEGGYVVAGTTSRNSNSDVWILKVDSQGNIAKSCPYVFASSTEVYSETGTSVDFPIWTTNNSISLTAANATESISIANIDMQCKGYEPGLSISCNPASILNITHIAECRVTPLRGFTGKVNLDCSDLLPGVRCHFNPGFVELSSDAPAFSRLRIWDFSLLNTGVYPFVVRVASDNYSSTFTLQLIMEKDLYSPKIKLIK